MKITLQRGATRLAAGALLGAALGLSLAAAPAAWAQGKGHGGKEERERDRDRDRAGPRAAPSQGAYFTDAHRDAVRAYYGQQYKSGRCPPGLAKKNNGCMPPGQAKKWAMGKPLPREVVFYPVPAPVMQRIPAAPPGYRYVRVANDILLISIGTAMVVDAIQDLMRY